MKLQLQMLKIKRYVLFFLFNIIRKTEKQLLQFHFEPKLLEYYDKIDNSNTYIQDGLQSISSFLYDGLESIKKSFFVFSNSRKASLR